LGVARTKYTDEEYRNEIKRWLLNENEALNSVLSFIERIFYISGNYDDDSLYKLLQEKLNSLDTDVLRHKQNHIFYLATPPSVYLEIIRRLGQF